VVRADGVARVQPQLPDRGWDPTVRVPLCGRGHEAIPNAWVEGSRTNSSALPRSAFLPALLAFFGGWLLPRAQCHEAPILEGRHVMKRRGVAGPISIGCELTGKRATRADRPVTPRR
jgi:hypothetical protein